MCECSAQECEAMQFSCSTALSCFICCLLSDCSIIIMAITTSWESAQWEDCLLTQSPAHWNISQHIGCYICIAVQCWIVLAWISPLATKPSSECGQDTVAMQLFHVPVFLPNTSLYAYCRFIVFWWITLCSEGKKNQQKEIFLHSTWCVGFESENRLTPHVNIFGLCIWSWIIFLKKWTFVFIDFYWCTFM